MRKQVKCETFKVPRGVFMSCRTWRYCLEPLSLRHAAVNSSGLGAMWHEAIWLGVWLWKVAIIVFGLHGADLSPTLITWFPVRYLGWVAESWRSAAWSAGQPAGLPVIHRGLTTVCETQGGVLEGRTLWLTHEILWKPQRNKREKKWCCKGHYEPPAW